MTPVHVYYLNEYQPYPRMLALQHRLHALRVAQQIDDVVLVLEHTPVITIGRTPEAGQHVLVSADMLKQQGIEVCTTDRGGDVTYHGPGQITVYYIMALQRRDIHEFVRLLEQSVIQLLAAYGVQSHIEAEYPGVWVGDQKICALGIAVKKWVSFHGIALNVRPDVTHFQYIVPCGIQSKGVTSLQQTTGGLSEQTVDIDQVKQAYIQQFAATFNRNVRIEEPEKLWHLTGR